MAQRPASVGIGRGRWPVPWIGVAALALTARGDIATLPSRPAPGHSPSQFFQDLTTPFFGANPPDAKVSQGQRDTFWLQGMQAGLNGVLDCIKVNCIKAFSETDFTDDLKRIDVPTLFIHGDDDQIVPIGASALLASQIVKGSTLRIYPGAPHGLCSTHKDQVNADLLAFLS